MNKEDGWEPSDLYIIARLRRIRKEIRDPVQPNRVNFQGREEGASTEAPEFLAESFIPTDSATIPPSSIPFAILTYMDDIEFEARIFGKVQGVLFRTYAKKRADELGIAGVARNLEDGSVEVIAQGERKKLEEFARLLKRGPVFSRVDEFEIDWHDTTSDTFTDFATDE